MEEMTPRCGTEGHRNVSALGDDRCLRFSCALSASLPCECAAPRGATRSPLLDQLWAGRADAAPGPEASSAPSRPQGPQPQLLRSRS
jgi:hypothetical protein